MRWQKTDMSGPAVLLSCTLLILLFLLLIFFEIWVFMAAWNIFVPAVFGGPTITMLQSLAAVVLLNIIGGAFRTLTTTTKN